MSAFFPSPVYVSEDGSGSTSLVSPINAALGPKMSLFLTENLRFEPALEFLLPWRKNIDGNQRTYTTLLKLHAGYFVNPKTEVFAGPGFQWAYLTGEKQAVTQYNGTSQSTYYTPEVSQSTVLGIIGFGVSYYVFDPLRAQLEFTIADAFSNSRRRVGFSLGAGYALF